MFRLFIAIFLATTLSADYNHEESTVLFGGGPSAFFENVNLITGEVIETNPAMQFYGCFPYQVSLTQTRNNSPTISLDEGLIVNFNNKNKPVYGHYYSPGTSNYSLQPKNKGNWGEFEVLHDSNHNKGLTNLSGGFLSGQNNFANSKCVIDKFAAGSIQFRNGDGSTKKMARASDLFETMRNDHFRYSMYSQTMPNGHEIVRNKKYYGYAAGREIWCFEEHKDYEQGLQKYKLQTSDGRVYKEERERFRFEYGYGKNYVVEDRWHPTKIEPHNAPPIFYKYIRAKGMPYVFVSSIVDCDGCETKYFYNDVCGFCNADRKENKYKLNRINKTKIVPQYFKRKKNPDGSPKYRLFPKTFSKYKFTYSTPTEINEGSTQVTDVLRNKYCVNYNKNKWVTSKQWKDRNDTVLMTENFMWGENQDQYGFLIEDNYQNSSTGTSIKSTKYSYDSAGNVSQILLSGAITAPESYDSCKTINTYSSDGLNLPLTSTEGGKTTEYCYRDGTNILTKRYIRVGEEIHSREFYDYDEYGALICHINDDGCSREKDNLNGVRVRTVKRIVPVQEKSCFGLPSEQYEYCVDTLTGTEILLRTRKYSYNLDGKITEERLFGPDGELFYSRKNILNKYSQPELIVNYAGEKTINAYSESGLLTSTECGGLIKHFQYDYARRKSTEIVGKDETKFSYDDMDNCTAITDSMGNTTNISYDPLNRPIVWVKPAVYLNGVSARPYEKKKLDFFGNIIEEVDADGFVVKKSYNINGQLFSIVHPDQSQEQFRYNIDGTLAFKTTRSGLKFEYSYDSSGRITHEREISASGEILSEMTKNYDRSLLASEVDAEGVVTFYSYDTSGRLVELRKGTQREEYAYDVLDRRICTTKWANDQDFVTYLIDLDGEGRTIGEKTLSPGGVILTWKSFRYDERGNKIHEITVDGVTETQYDEQDRPTLIITPTGNETCITYDKVKNDLGQYILSKRTLSPNDVLHVETHDALERIVLDETFDKNGKLSARVEFAYDLRGNMTRRLDHCIEEGTGVWDVCTTREYDSMSKCVLLVEADDCEFKRVTQTEYNLFDKKQRMIKPDQTELQYVYDAKGRLNELIAPDIHYRYRYDKLDRVTEITDLVSDEVMTREYDDLGNIVIEEFQNGKQVNYSYDGLGRRTKIKFNDFAEAHYSYEGCFLKKVISTLNGQSNITTFDTYDLAGRELKRELPFSLGYLEHTYNQEGRVLHIQTEQWNEVNHTYDSEGNLIGRQSSDSNSYSTYDYDCLNQLIDEQGPLSHSYLYDSIFNRVEKDDQRFNYDNLSRLTSCDYDFCGNLRHYDGNEFYYDALDRLIQVKTPTKTIRYCYDALGRRIARQSDKKLTRYFYDGNCEVGSEVNGKLRDFRFLAGGIGAELGASLLIYNEGKTLVPIHDIVGNIRALLNEKNTCQLCYYSAFGESYAQGFSSPWLFSSKRYDADTELYDFGKRFYSANLGHFISCDPLGHNEGQNLYHYVFNRPLTQVDPLGLFCMESDWTREELNMGLHTATYQGASAYNMGLAADRCCSIGLPSAHEMFWAGYNEFASGTSYEYKGISSISNYSASQLGWLTAGTALDLGVTTAAFKAAKWGARSGSRIFQAVNRGANECSMIKNGTFGLTNLGENHVVRARSNGFLGKKGFQLRNTNFQKVRNTPAIIHGRSYGSHALDQMQNRGFTPSVVEEALQYGISSPNKVRGRMQFYHPVNNISVITEDSKVVTVMYGRPK